MINPEHVVAVPTRYSKDFLIYHNDFIISASLARYGEYQQIELDLLLSLPESKGVVYDIGSNIGYHATAFATQCQQLYCFEANPQHFSLLRRNLAHASQSMMFNAAVTDHVGHLNVGKFDTSEQGNYGLVQVGTESGYSVPAVTIDHLVNSGQIKPPTLIKVDVESHEPAVLRGSVDSLQKYQPVVYFEAQESANMPELYRFFDNMGYNMGWSIVMNFNPRNFANSSENLFGNTAIFGVLAVPKNQPMPNLMPVLNENDTWEQLIQRL